MTSFFLLVCGKSTVLLLLVVTGKASSSSSLSKKGRMKTHIPCTSTIYSSSFVDTSSSSKSNLAFDIVFGGLGSKMGFLLKGLSTFCKSSRSKGSLGVFSFNSSLKVTILDFVSSNAFFLTKAKIGFSTTIASFMFSAKVGLATLSTKIVVFEGRVEMYHSFCTSTLGLDATGILFNNLLKHELKSLIGSLDSTFKLERSLRRVVFQRSSSHLVRNYSWKTFQLSMEPDGNQKYQDLADPSKV